MDPSQMNQAVVMKSKGNQQLNFPTKILSVLILICVPSVCSMQPLVLPQRNFWLEWANPTGNTDFCLHLTAAVDPFKTCLIATPQKASDVVLNNQTRFNCSSSTNNSHCLALLLNALRTDEAYELPWDPQEMNLLDSRPSNKFGCILFGHWDLTKKMHRTWLTPHRNYNTTQYCGEKAYGWGTGQIHLNLSTAVALPTNHYLICGDRAWQGIPRGAHGGPCYIGRLALFAPSKEKLLLLNSSQTTTYPPIVKRSVDELDPNCNDEVDLWGTTARIFASLFPPAGTAHALLELQRLACWTVKQANVTTSIISQLAQDMSSLRQAVLQNRAAIDYLLLAQGKGCEDFQGLCCFNLSDHSKSIHEQLQWLQDHSRKITVDSNPFDSWLMSFGISAWMKDTIKLVIVVLLIIMLLLCMAPCIIQCFAFQIKRLANVVFEKREDAASLTRAISVQPILEKLP